MSKPDPSKPPHLLGPAQAAAVAGVEVRELRRLTKQGRLHVEALTVDGSPLYRVRDVVRLAMRLHPELAA